MAQGIISFDDERKAGRLNNPMETTLTVCQNLGQCKAIGIISKENVIKWNDQVTLDDLKAVVQGIQDMTRWQMNRYKGTPG